METKNYLSKREDNTYCIISSGMPVNNYTTKENCLNMALKMKINISIWIWSAQKTDWIVE